MSTGGRSSLTCGGPRTQSGTSCLTRYWPNSLMRSHVDYLLPNSHAMEDKNSPTGSPITKPARHPIMPPAIAPMAGLVVPFVHSWKNPQIAPNVTPINAPIHMDRPVKRSATPGLGFRRPHLGQDLAPNATGS